jgi:hypothetical protein
MFINDLEHTKSHLPAICYSFGFSKEKLIEFSALITYFKIRSLVSDVAACSDIDSSILYDLVKIYPIFSAEEYFSLPPQLMINILLAVIKSAKSRFGNLKSATSIIKCRYSAFNHMFSSATRARGLVDSPEFHPLAELLWSLVYLSSNDNSSVEQCQTDPDSEDNYCLACRRSGFTPWKLLSLACHVANRSSSSSSSSSTSTSSSDEEDMTESIPHVICEYCLRTLLTQQNEQPQEMGVIVCPIVDIVFQYEMRQ